MRKPGARSRLMAATAGITLALAIALSSSPLAGMTTGSRSVAEAAPTGTNSSNSIYYRQTGHYIKDAFLNYWLANGGLNTYGYPITEETSVNGVPVQYFQRARFEYRPDSRRPWKVELTQVGSIVTQGRNFTRVEPAAAIGDKTYFPETGHTLGGSFKQHWQSKGGIAIFGYPISEEMRENGVTVQYFERARFELVGQGRVQLGHLGTEVLNKHMAEGLAGFDPAVATAQTRPGFQMSFRGEATWYSAAAFGTTWERIIALNKSWGNLPQNFVGRGLYAAAPADLSLYGRMARVTRGNRSVMVQFIDVIAYGDIPYVRSKGIVIDLAEEAYRALGTAGNGRYEVKFDVFWPGEEP